MPQNVTILIVEDNSGDCALILREIRKAGFDPTWTRVDNESDYLNELEKRPDIVLSDYNLPQFNGFRALDLLKDKQLEIPFILVSGTIGEDTAVTAIKRGATDYLIKDRLARLGQAVIHALEETRQKSERRRAQEESRTAKAQVQQLIENSPAVVYSLKLDGGRVTPRLVSENITSLLGFSVAEAMAEDWWSSHVHPDDIKGAQAAEKKTAKLGKLDHEYRIRRKDGTYCWIEDSRRIVRNVSGMPIEIAGIWRDISERKRAEEAISEVSSNRLKRRRTTAATEFAILLAASATLFALATYFDWFDPVTRWFLARPFEQMDQILLTPAFLALGALIFALRRWRESVSELSAEEKSRDALRVLHDELDRRVQQRTAQLASVNESLRGEIAERLRAEAGLRLFRTLVDSSNDGLEVIDPETGRFLDASERASTSLGYTREELLTLRVQDVSPEVQVTWPEAAQNIRTKGSVTGEAKHLRKDGTTFPIEYNAKWVQLDRAYIVTVVRDISERKKLEEQFLRMQRLESVGMLAAGIAHDLNNVLSPIGMVAPLLKSSTTQPRDLRLLDTLEQCASRGAGLVRQILGFVHGIGGEPTLVQVKHLIRDIANVATETFPRSITIRQDAPADLWPIMANPTQIHQILLNLCVNARDAMPDGGTLRLRAENCRLDSEGVRALGSLSSGLDASPGAWTVLHVEDTGSGIPPEVVARIWEPFFTTKEVGKGTGLGLSTVRGIVETHRGFCVLQTQVGRGTAFRIYLPAAESASPLAFSSHSSADIRGQDELIFLVDDESDILNIASAVLTKAGYRVMTAIDGVKAIALFSSRSSEVALMITDLDMPNLDGTTLAKIIRRSQPKIKILAMSGIPGARERAMRDNVANAFIEKPFTGDALLSQVRELLHSTDFST